MTSAFDGIVLGGGRSRRMGTNKVLLEVDGRALLRTAVEALAGARKIALVAPPEVCAHAFPQGLPSNVVQTLEDPPDGGPVAGIQAGLAALAAPTTADADGGLANACLPAPPLAPPRSPDRVHPAQRTPEPAPTVGIVAADHPGAVAAMRALRVAGGCDLPPGVDGYCALGPEGVPQWMLGFYRRQYILNRLDDAFAGSGQDVAVRRLFAAATLEVVPLPPRDTLDLDSPSDLEEYSVSQANSAEAPERSEPS